MSKAAQLAALIGSGQAQGNKNLIINGDMQIFQRATAATAANNSYATVDRWAFGESTDGAYTSEQSTDTPTGTGFSVKAQVTTADTSIAAAQYAYIYQNIEAQNLQSLQYGTSSAKTLTVSFFVKSNKTGTYTFTIYKQDATSYIIPIEYTISSANTWEKKTITISPTAGSTSFITASAGAIANDNGLGFQIAFGLAWGSNFHGTNNTWSSNSNHYGTSNQVNWMDSTSNNFYLSQVQLEIGETATPFEHRSFADELHSCKRFYQKSFVYSQPPVNSSNTTSNSYNGAMGGYCGSNNSGIYSGGIQLDPPMRATPTMTTYGNSNGHWGYLSPTNTGTVTYSAGGGYVGHIRENGFSIGQNIGSNTLYIGFGQWTAEAEL